MECSPQLINEMRRRGLWLMMVILWSLPLLLVPTEFALGQSEAGQRQRMYEHYQQLRQYIRGGSVEPHWTGVGAQFWFSENKNAVGATIHLVDPARRSHRELFEVEPFREELQRVLDGDVPESGIPFTDLVLNDDDENLVELSVGDRLVELDIESGALREIGAVPEQLPQTIRGEVISPGGNWTARIEGNNVWLKSLRDSSEKALTTDGTEDQPWGVPFEPGLLWSPDGTKLSVVRMDLSSVPRTPIVSYLTDNPEVEWAISWEAGGPFEKADIFIFDVITEKQVRVLDDSIPDLLSRHKYRLGWSLDSSELFFAPIASNWRSLNVMAANAETGEVRTLFQETRETFFHIPAFRPLAMELMSEAKQFVWKSDRDGWHHLYLYDLEGNMIRRLTGGEFEVVEVIGVDEVQGWVYFTAHLDTARPYDSHVARVSLLGGEVEQLTEGRGIHSAVFSPGMEFFLDTYANVNLLPTVELRTVEGEFVETLSVAEIEAPADFIWVEPEEFVVKAADGETNLYGILYKPYDFDPSLRYPVIEIMTGRPNVAINEILRSHSLGGEALAQLGFVVLALDARGTPERGHDFHATIYREVGRYEIPDHVAALNQLFNSRPYLDRSRVGVFGHSWGGYYTIRAILQAPEVYHVAVASAPYDPRGDALIPFLGLPHENPEGYEYASNSGMADQLQGHLLIQHGTADTNSYFKWTMDFVAALAQVGKPVDLMILPDQAHNFGSSASYVEKARVEYLRSHLQNVGTGQGR